MLRIALLLLDGISKNSELAMQYTKIVVPSAGLDDIPNIRFNNANMKIDLMGGKAEKFKPTMAPNVKDSKWVTSRFNAHIVLESFETAEDIHCMSKLDMPDCPHCPGVKENVPHFIFSCPQYTRECHILTTRTGRRTLSLP
ncbi:hypothetical protein HYDPIDRAFT_169979 [Hydnomerulius pinastri MD-312]|uniref:Reverse transcriptase zinc-binding domain-containing protein n=1 Tax=Hydnomerulius pinastri MD-312 TaxID=994086 RepID=A0A0C9W3U4_9AGAM|nr:hypothetical protein HYDPIDRAFT_169979 [Hydnomerulius pinastri MD-312]